MFRFMLKFVIVLCVVINAFTILAVTQGESIPSWRVYYTTRLDNGFWVIHEFEVDRRLTRRLFTDFSLRDIPTISSNQRYVMTLESGGFQLFDTVTGETHLFEGERSFSFSPDSHVLMIYYLDGFKAIELFNNGTVGEPHNAIPDNLADPNRLLAWSPDSNMLAFATNVEGNSRIYVYSFAQNNITEVTSSIMTSAYSPVWSSDGTTLAFVGGDDTEAHIYTIGVDGTNLRQLTVSPVTLDSHTLTWSPDGRFIALITEGTFGQGLYVLATDGSGEMIGPIDRNWEASQIIWSPDSTRILFRSARTSDLYVVNADGRFLHRLTNDDNTHFLLP